MNLARAASCRDPARPPVSEEPSRDPSAQCRGDVDVRRHREPVHVAGALPRPSRFDLEFACMRRRGGFVSELDERGIPLLEYNVATFRSVTALAQQARLARHIPSVASTSSTPTASTAMCSRFRRPGSPARPSSSLRFGTRAVPHADAKAPAASVCRFADCVLVNAEAVKTGWSRRIQPLEDCRHSKRRGIRRFGVAAASERLRTSSACPHGAPLVGVVSRLSRLKGLEAFLERRHPGHPVPGRALSRRRGDQSRRSCLPDRV